MLSLIRAWINGWVNHREVGDLRHHRTHYDVIVMFVAPFVAWWTHQFIIKMFSNIKSPFYFTGTVHHAYIQVNITGWPYAVEINPLRPRQNGRHFAEDTFLNENVGISIKISLKFAPKGPINNIPALVQTMAWHRPGDQQLSEPMVVSILMHICVTRLQWVNV